MAELRIRPFRAGDAELLAGIVRRCLLDVNSRDYPPQIIARLCAYYTAGRFTELAACRHIYVAESGTVCGTVSRDRNTVHAMFVSPGQIGQGIGRRLLQYAEGQAAADGHGHMEADGHGHMETAATITAHGFYLAQGYTDLRTDDIGFGPTYLMRKPLR